MIFDREKDLLMEEFGNQALVFDLKTNLPYALNRVASLILMNTDGKKTIEAVAEEVCREYHVDLDRALWDVKKLYQELDEKGIIKRVS